MPCNYLSDITMAGEVDSGLYEEDENELADRQLPIAFNEPRHKEIIEGSHCLTQTWRMKERVSVYFFKYILCVILNNEDKYRSKF